MRFTIVASAIATLALLGATPAAAQLQVCAKVDRQTGEVRDGTPVKLRAECKTRKDGSPIEVSIGAVGGLATTIGGLSCAPGEVAKWNGSSWICDADGDAETKCVQDEVLTGDGTCLNLAQALDDAVLDATARLVFVTSERMTGNILAEAQNNYPACADVGSGLQAADCICTSLAEESGLYGSFKAWLSDNIHSPSTRFAKSPWPYLLVDGTVVADDWGDLTDGNIQNAIMLDQNGNNRSVGDSNATNSGELVATNTSPDGTPRSTRNCGDWTSSSGTNLQGGALDKKNSRWTHFPNATLTCSQQRRLYCFEQ